MLYHNTDTHKTYNCATGKLLLVVFKFLSIFNKNHIFSNWKHEINYIFLRGAVSPIVGFVYSSINSTSLFPFNSFMQAALLLCGKAEMTYPTTPTMES